MVGKVVGITKPPEKMAKLVGTVEVLISPGEGLEPIPVDIPMGQAGIVEAAGGGVMILAEGTLKAYKWSVGGARTSRRLACIATNVSISGDEAAHDQGKG